MPCACPFSYNKGEVNGVCPKCGAETVDGLAYDNCEYGDKVCDECLHLECNEDC